ncbi:MAG TPA: helix-turn-helix transcriptional regulator [Pseudolabrys sp.]|nr:helix-turn-helix transcriptional regulator [Pseudolabrys sp.]
MPKPTLAALSHVRRVAVHSPLSPPDAIAVLAALAQPTRLEIFRLLLKHEPIGITAGVIAETVGAPHNSISTHLAILVRAGLLRSARDGRSIVYRADIEGMRALVGFLVDDCCDGHPELCNLIGGAEAEDCGCAPSTAGAAPKKAKSGTSSKSKKG